MSRPRLHGCAAPDCANQIPAAKLMCRAHWFQLPTPLRVAINATWRHGPRADYLANVRQAEQLLVDDEVAAA